MRIENSFILAPGIGEKTERRLWKNDITHWNDFESSDALNGKQDRVLNFLEKARRNLDVGNTVFFKDKLPANSNWRLYRNFESQACFFDIETTGLDREQNKVTTVSFHRNGETKTLVAGEDLTQENLEKEFFKSSMLVSFNGKRFDQPFLEHNFDLDIEKPHVDLMYPCRKLGLSGGLKKIEEQLQIDREQEDIDGKAAIRLWKRYENKDDQAALEKLVEYNQYDARNLRQLFEEVHSRLTQKIYHPHIRH